MATSGTPVPSFSQEDLKEPTLYKLNQAFATLYGKIGNLYDPGEQVALGATLTVPNALASQQTSVPTDGNTLITLTIAKMLFGAPTIRTALATGTAPNINEIVQPIVGGGTGSSALPAAPVIIVDTTLSANTTIATPIPVSIGQVLGYFLRQDGTGGWVTTWSSPPYRGATSTAHSGQIGLGTLKNTWSLIVFISETDPVDNVIKWWKACLVTNQT